MTNIRLTFDCSLFHSHGGWQCWFCSRDRVTEHCWYTYSDVVSVRNACCIIPCHLFNSQDRVNPPWPPRQHEICRARENRGEQTSWPKIIHSTDKQSLIPVQSIHPSAPPKFTANWMSPENNGYYICIVPSFQLTAALKVPLCYTNRIYKIIWLWSWINVLQSQCWEQNKYNIKRNIVRCSVFPH